MRTFKFIFALLVTLFASQATAQGEPTSTGGGGTEITLANVGAAPSAKGATLVSGTLTLQPADATHPGLVTTGTQTFGGTKTFSSVEITTDLAVGDDLNVGNGDVLAETVSVNDTVYGVAGGLYLYGTQADGPGAKGVVLGNTTTLANATADTVTIINNGSTEAQFPAGGGLKLKGNFDPMNTVSYDMGSAAKIWGTAFLHGLWLNSGNIRDNSASVRINVSDSAGNSYIGEAGATGAANTFDNTTTMTGAGELLTLKNNTTKKAFFDIAGQYENTTAGAGIILKSPDGTRYLLTVANGGTLAIGAAP